MLKSSAKIAWRNIVRSKSFSALNIAGLAISLAAFILMALYIENELSYDRFNVNAANVYRVTDDKQTPDVLLRSAKTAAPVAPALLQEYPEIKQAVRLLPSEALIKYGDKLFEERAIYFSDKNLFELFSFTLKEGDAATALKEPETIVLTSSMAKKYFGNTGALGKILSVDKKAMTVTGVVNDVPATSHFQFDFLVSMSTAQEKGSGYDWLFTNWYSNNGYTYVLLPEDYNIGKLEAQMAVFDKRHKEANDNTIHRYSFEKLSDIYLHSNRDDQVGKTGNLTALYVFAAVAFFILLIACVNFINLSTARSVLRAKEVAVKKVAGAGRDQLIAQFLTESFLMTGIALLMALLIAYAVLPAFNSFSGKVLSLSLFSFRHVMVLTMLFSVVGLLAGIYPAFVLSSFKPVTALKGKLNDTGWSISIRKGLVVFQFAVSVVLIVCSIVVYAQMAYLQKHDLGFAPSQTLVINFEGDAYVKERMDAVKRQLLAVSGVQEVSASSNVPGDGNADSWSMDFVKSNGDTIHTELPVYLVDYGYLNQFGIPVVAGRIFSKDYAADSVQSMLINETALKQLGFRSAEEAMGVTVGMYPNDAKITGVVKDFNFESLQKKVSPLAIRILPFKYRLLSLKMSTANVQKTVAAIEAEWKKLVPERPLEYNFLDESFNKQYGAEIKFGQVFGAFTLLAIVVACLGLFGLALFSVQQRRKEIGIRKVLGATVANLAATLSKDFMWLVLIAVFVATPISYYFMHNWLNDFAYRITMSPWIFLAAGAAAGLIAFMTISYQTVKAAVVNPVKNLRTE